MRTLFNAIFFFALTLSLSPAYAGWGAVACGEWLTDNGNTVHAASGMGINYPTEADASAAALQSCQEEGGGQDCKVEDTFNTGCGYITTGVRHDANGGAHATCFWGSADYIDQQCQGWDCKPKIGGCIANEPQ